MSNSGGDVVVVQSGGATKAVHDRGDDGASALESQSETPITLEEILAENSEVMKFMSEESWSEFLKSPSEEFTSNLDFLKSVNGIFEVKYHANQISEKILHVFRKPQKDEKFEVTVGDKSRALLEKLHRYGKQLIRKRLEQNRAKHVLEPRCVRLAKLLELSEKEMFAMAYVTLSYGNYVKSEIGSSYSFSSMMFYAEMTLPEALEFISPSRAHVKEGIINPDEDDPVSYGIKIPFTTCCVLTGTKLSEAELLKIDKTVLATVVAEEEGGESLLRSSAFGEQLGKGESDKESDKEGEEAEEGEEGEGKEGKSKKKKFDDGDDIFDILRAEVQAEKELALDTKAVDEDPSSLAPYTTNITYLSEHIEWVAMKIRVTNLSREREEDLDRDPKQELQLREMRAKERMLKAKCERKLALTLESGKWMPRLERLALRLSLDPFEKLILLTLVGNIISCKISPDTSRYRRVSNTVENFAVGDFLRIFCTDFEQEIQSRSYFYKGAKLVKEGIIRLSDSWDRELMNTTVELDRRMLDFIVGLDTEFSELVEGSHLYTPKVKLDQVIMPEDQKKLIVDTVRNFDKFSRAAKKLGLTETITYGTGMLLLFFGKSGTGKTMMANALAEMLGKRILLINYPSLGDCNADLIIKFIFREAKLTDSILFFDECETIFLSRDKSVDRGLNLLLTEIERHNGLIIMATNRAFDLDEAMHRRITLAIEFRQPDPFLRAKIWRELIPPSIKIHESVDFQYLALKFELTGGFIKNAILCAISEAITRDGDAPTITQQDLEKGAVNQLRGRLAMVDFDRRVVPSRGLEEMIVAPDVVVQLQRIIQIEKARQVLFSEWGYSEKMCNDQGTTCLFYGPPGTGKTLAAEAIGFETGKPLKIVNCAALINKYVGETGKNIEKIFQEAKTLDAILVFDDAEALFGIRSEGSSSTDKYSNMDTAILLYHMERFPGIAILTTNLVNNIDAAFFRRFRFFVEFKMPPVGLREKLWKQQLPPRAPLSSDVNFKALADRYNFTGGVIKNCCFKASAAAALRVDKTKRIITMDDLTSAADEELKIHSAETPFGLFT